MSKCVIAKLTLSERLVTLGIIGAKLRTFLETPPTSQHIAIEGLKGKYTTKTNKGPSI